MCLIAVILLGFVSIAGFTDAVQADGVDDTLLFYRQLPDGNRQIVSIGNQATHRIDFSEQQCFRISNLNDRVAIVDKEMPKNITVLRLDGTLELEVDWDNSMEWNTPCSFSWGADDLHLLVYTRTDELGTTQPAFYMLDVSSGEITGPHSLTSVYCSTGSSDVYGPHGRVAGMTCAELTSQLPGLPEDAFFSVAPDSRFILFDRCVSGDFRINSRFETEECVGPSEAAIYDLELNELVTVLVDAPSLERNRRNGLFSPTGNRFTWSPSGRFLAYKPYSDALNIFDVQLRQYWSPITIEITSYSFGNLSSFQWSPDESRLALWLYSENGQDYIGGMFDSNTEDLKFMNESYPSVATYPSHWYWSPDNETIAFVSSGNLFLWNVNTGDGVFVEDNVAQILAWIPE